MRFVIGLMIGIMGALPVAAQVDPSPTPPAATDPATPPRPEAAAPATDLAMEDVIQRQLDAFNARDVDTAWTYASPMIQGMFGTAGNFGMMVNQGYPMVWDNSNARFVAVREAGGRTFHQVMVQDTNGVLHMLEYAMIATPQGWKIDGVSLMPRPDVGV